MHTNTRTHTQGPLSRFGDTAANTGVLALLEDVDMPVGLKTFAASAAAGLFRICLMPVDALKTIMQVGRTLDQLQWAARSACMGQKVSAMRTVPLLVVVPACLRA